MFANFLHTHLVGMNALQYLPTLDVQSQHTRLCYTMTFSLSMFHAGHGLVLQHFRETEECGGVEELEPIEINRKYDFNYQVANDYQFIQTTC